MKRIVDILGTLIMIAAVVIDELRKIWRESHEKRD